MRFLITNESEIVDTILKMKKRIDTLPYNLDNGGITKLQEMIRMTRKSIIDNSFQKDWKEEFIIFGAIALYELQESAMVVVDDDYIFEFATFLLGKHKMYGAEPFDDWKEVGVIMRLGSKVSRLLNILENGESNLQTDEPALDTLKDILGYCILGCHLDKL